jgi:predicted metal-dependent hydrolase
MTEQKLIDREHSLFRGNSAASEEEHALIVRDERFCRNNPPSRWWLNGDPIATAWYNSVSSSLPRGEAFIVDSTKAYRDEVPPRLADMLRAFIRQEVNHSREHLAFNRYAEAHGYDMTELDRLCAQGHAQAEHRSREDKLAISFVFEHFAGVLSDQLLRHPRHLAGGEPDAVELWRWHSAEEIEHKSVTYDVWLHATRNWSGFKRWRTRVPITVVLTHKFLRNRIRDALSLLEQDGITGWNAKRRLYAFLLWKPGLLRMMFPQWATILLPGFHPWKHDNEHLLRQYRRRTPSFAQ